MAKTILDTLVVRIGPEIFGMQALRRLEGGIQAAQAKLNAFGNKLAVAGAPLAGAAATTVKTYYNFQVAMNQTQATLRATSEEMEELRQQAKDLGSTTQFSASQAAEAQNAFAQKGYTQLQILEATPHALSLAAAGQLEMGQAATIVSGQINSFGLEITDAARVADVLAEAASKSSTSVAELEPALRQVAPVSKQAGISLEQTAAYIGVLRDANFEAGQSGTALRNVLARMAAPRKFVASKLIELGLDPENIAQQIEGGKLQQVLETFRTSGMGLGDAKVLFGAENMAAAMTLIEGSAHAANLTEIYKNSAGASKEMADIQNQGIVGAIRTLISAFEGLQIVLGESGLGDWTKTAAEYLTSLTNELANADEWVQNLTAIILAGGPALIAFGLFLKGVAIALGPFVWLLRAGAIMMAALNFVMRMNPYVLIISSLIALIMWWEDIVDVFTRAKDRFIELLREWGVPVDDIFEWINTAWNNVKLGTLDIMAAMPTAAQILDFTTKMLNKFTANVGKIDYQELGRKIGNWVGEAVKFAASLIPISIIGNFFKSIFSGDAAGAETRASAVETAKSFVNALKAALASLGSLIIGIVEGAFDIDLFTTGQQVAIGFRNGLNNWLDTLEQWVATTVGNAFELKWEITQKGKAVIAGFKDGVKLTFIGFKTWIFDTVKAAFKIDLIESGKALIDSFIDGIKQKASDLKQAVKEAFGNTIGKLLPHSDAEEGPLSRLTEAGEAIVRTLAEGARNAGGLGGLIDPNALSLPLGTPLPATTNIYLTVTLNEGAIVINAEGSDADEIASRIGQSLNDQWRALAEQVDSRVQA